MLTANIWLTIHYVFWDMILCCWACSSQHFEGLWCLLLHGLAATEGQGTMILWSVEILIWHNVISLKTWIFSIVTVRTSNDHVLHSAYIGVEVAFENWMHAKVSVQKSGVWWSHIMKHITTQNLHRVHCH